MTKASERILEGEVISKLQELKYSYRKDIRDRATLEANFREKFQELNPVKLTDEEFISTLTPTSIFCRSTSTPRPTTPR